MLHYIIGKTLFIQAINIDSAVRNSIVYYFNGRYPLHITVANEQVLFNLAAKSTII